MNTRLFQLALALIVCLASVAVNAQVIQKDDILVGLSNGIFSGSPRVNYKYYNQSASTWSNLPWEQVTNNYQTGSAAFGPWFAQSVVFDNAGGIKHNASGNLLVANFGNSFTGFEIFNIATDGSNTWSSVWSSHAEAGGTYGSGAQGMNLSKRGTGLSVNPGNTRVAWFSSDGYTFGAANGSQIMVLDYDAGSAFGSGQRSFMPGSEGAWIGGPRITGNNQMGAAGRTGSTQGTTWLNDDVVLGFNGFGEVVAWNVANVAPGADAVPRGPQASTPMVPTVDTNWQIINSQISFTGQATDILYYEEIDPNHVYASVTRSDFSASLYRFAYNSDPNSPTLTLNGTIDGLGNQWWNGSYVEPREIAFDSEGNLYWSCYAGSGSSNIVAVLQGAATNDLLWTSPNPQSDIAVFLMSGDYTAYNGIDIASSMGGAQLILGDFNGDGVLSGLDIPGFKTALADPDGWASANPDRPHPNTLGDFNNDGVFSGLDIPGFKTALAGAAVAVPEPGTLLLMGAGALALIRRRRSA